MYLMMYLITGKNEKILRIRAVPVKQEKIKSPDFRGEYGVTWDCQVVPDGIMNRSNDKKLRDFILEQCEIDAVISLPLNTFFTTNKKTYILALTKKYHHQSERTVKHSIRSAWIFLNGIGEFRNLTVDNIF